MGIQIFANLDANSLDTARVQASADLRPRGFKNLAAGDSTVVDLFLTGQDGLLNIQDYPTRRLGIGNLNARPTGGTFDYGAQTGLAYNISAAALDTAITAETAACTVTQITPFVYKVVFDANGAQTIAAVDATDLTPSSTVSIKRLVTGDASTQEQWLVRIYQNPIALIDADWTNISGSGIRGALNLGTEGIYKLLGSGTSASATIELELTDSDGDIQTIFQVPVTIVGEVVGEGVTGVATFDSYVTSAALAIKFSTGNVVWVSKSGSDSSGAVDRFDLPFLTVTAAQSAAASGDTILVLPGDYSAETDLAGKDGVTYQGLDGAILPAFNVTTAITIKGSGLCQRLICNNAGAVMDMPGMSTVTFIYCEGGTQTAGNAATFISCGGGTQTAGNAGTSISCSAGTQTAGNAGTYIFCSGGTQTAGNAGTYINCSSGTQAIHLTDQSHDGTTYAPIYLSGSGSLNLYGDTSESTESGGTVVDIANNWSGSLYMAGIKLVATTVGTDEATTGITYGTGVTGSVQLKDCTIITAQNGTGTAQAIDAPSAQTVYVQGTLNTTHDVDLNISLVGGDIIINSNFV